MSCCRGRAIVVPAPAPNSGPKVTYNETSRVCNKIRIDSFNLIVVLRGNQAFVNFDSRELELSFFLKQANNCTAPDVKQLVFDIANIYGLAISSGTIQKLTIGNQTPRVSVNYLRSYRS